MKKLTAILLIALTLSALNAASFLTLGCGASAYTDSASMRFLPGGYLEGGFLVDITKSGNVKFDSSMRIETGVDARKNDYILFRTTLASGLMLRSESLLTISLRPTASFVMFISNLKDHPSALDLSLGGAVDFGFDISKEGIFLIYTGLDVEYGFYERNIYYDISLGGKWNV